MRYQELLAYCLAKPGAWQDEPWEDDVVVKVDAKIFAFLGSAHDPDAPTSGAGSGGRPVRVGLKCGGSRDEADEWLRQYPHDASTTAYIGRHGWNTLRLGGAIGEAEIRAAIDASYDLVVARLPKSRRPPSD